MHQPGIEPGAPAWQAKFTNAMVHDVNNLFNT